MNIKERSYAEISQTGLSADYVFRETKRALAGAEGTKTLIWPGIDIDIPTEKGNSKCTPESVKAAVTAAFQAGAPGYCCRVNIPRCGWRISAAPATRFAN